MSEDSQSPGTSRKRRRISPNEEEDGANQYDPSTVAGRIGSPDFASSFVYPAAGSSHTDREANVSTIISNNTEIVEQTVTPLLDPRIPAQHLLPEASGDSHKLIPSQAETSQTEKSKKSYCYRHRPGSKCRRQVDEPSMDQLQRVRGAFGRGFAEVSDELIIHRNSKPSLKTTNRALLMCGPFSPLPRPSNENSCFKASSPNAASPSCHTYPPASAISSGSIFSVPFLRRFHSGCSAIWIQLLCAKPHRSAGDGEFLQTTMWSGTECVNSTSTGSATNADGVFLCSSERDCGLRKGRYNYEPPGKD